MSATRPRSTSASLLFVFSAVCLLFTFAACSSGDPDTTVESSADLEQQYHQEIRALVADFMAAYNGEDPEAFVALFTDDAIRMPPNSKSLVGIDRIRDNTVTIFATFDREVSVNVEESIFSGDFAVTRGTWALRLTSKTGDTTTEDVGKWLNLSVRGDDGKWRIARNMWNSDLPSDS